MIIISKRYCVIKLITVVLKKIFFIDNLYNISRI